MGRRGEPLQAGGQRGDQTHQRVWEIHPDRAKRFHSGHKSHVFSSFVEQNRAELRLRWDDPVLLGEAEI